MTAAPRRTCPACCRRYAGLVSADCPVCQGAGVLTLGAAALHHYDPQAVARAVELHLEAQAARIRTTLPLAQHRQALEAVVDDLRIAGVLATIADTTGTRSTSHPTTTPQAAERAAYTAVRSLGSTPDAAVLTALRATPVPLTRARPRDGRPPTASATGHPAALATIADPLDPLGPDTGVLELRHATTTHRARVIAAAVPTTANRRSARP